MYQVKNVAMAESDCVQYGETPRAQRTIPLYHWLGADAEQVAEAPRTIPLYHWLGADAERVAAGTAS